MDAIICCSLSLGLTTKARKKQWKLIKSSQKQGRHLSTLPW